MQVYMFVHNIWHFPPYLRAKKVQKSFVPVEVVDRQVFWGGVGLHNSCLVALV